GAWGGGRARAAAARRRGRRNGRGRRVHGLPRRVAAGGAGSRGGAATSVRRGRAGRLTPGRPTFSAHASRGGRHPARMTTPIVLDCDPGHDDAIAILLALASPELELLGVTTTYGNQTIEKTTANALRVLELAGRGDVPVAAGADRPLEREPFVAAYVHGESGLDGPDLPPPQGEPADDHAVD